MPVFLAVPNSFEVNFKVERRIWTDVWKSVLQSRNKFDKLRVWWRVVQGIVGFLAGKRERLARKGKVEDAGAGQSRGSDLFS